MYTQCPRCLTVFSLDAQRLAAAAGHVRCGYCDTTFDALVCLAPQLPPEPFRHLPVHAASGHPPPLDLAVYRPPPEPEPESEPAAEPEPELEFEPATERSAEIINPVIAAEPDFSQLVFTPRAARSPERQHAPARAQARRKKTPQPAGEPRRGLWLATCLLLGLLLGAQLLWAQRAALLSDATTGAWLRGTCAALGCRLPLVADPSRLQLLARNVQPSPGVPRALLVSASVRNDAPFAQPYPVVTLVLSNAQGQPVAMRRLLPDEYMGDSRQREHGLAPGATAAILVEVTDPGGQAVAFEFRFERPA